MFVPAAEFAVAVAVAVDVAVDVEGGFGTVTTDVAFRRVGGGTGTGEGDGLLPLRRGRLAVISISNIRWSSSHQPLRSIGQNTLKRAFVAFFNFSSWSMTNLQ
mmetsp:Transcript_43419/g.47097  ORF Transcript_43419/g.47097 Transcript_43419/m.47097 type:complete len:103 (+) Transcript_43419:630-938(+)